MRVLTILILVALLIGAAAYAVLLWPLRNPHPTPRPGRGTLALRDARIYPAPDSAPIELGTVLMRDGKIIAVGRDVVVPPDAQVINCSGCVVTAGFWNAHIHFTEPKWNSAPWGSADALNAQLADMLTSRGFTTVVDVGSDLRITLSLRRRIESGDLRGPRIYTAGSGFFPPNGIPYYLRDNVPAWIRWQMPQPATPAAAAALERRNIRRGADLLKLFTGSIVEAGTVLPMPEAIARAAVDVAHEHHQLVFSHPSDLAGTLVALHSGVDVLAHAPNSTTGIDEAMMRSLVDHRMAMIPTLKLFETVVPNNPEYMAPILNEVRQFHNFAGQLIFGTDVGFLTDYNTEDEFRALAQAGLNMHDILRMLTTAPAARFDVSAETGAVAPGKAADLVVLDADPARDITAFAKVRVTIRNGEVIFRRN